MDKARTREIAEGAARALQAYAEAEGLSLEYRGGQYGNTYCTLKFQFSERDAEGRTQTKEAEAFKKLATVYGLKPDDLGRTFQFKGTTYAIEGLIPTKRKYPIAIRNLLTDTLHGMTAGAVKRLLEGEPA